MGLSTEKFGLDIFFVFHPIHVYSIRQSSTQCRIAAACPCDVRTNPNKWIWLVIAWYNLHSVCVCVLQSPLDSIHAGHRQFVGFGRCVSTHSICGKCQCMHCQSYVWLLRLSCILLFAIQFPILHTNRVSTYIVVVPHVHPQRMKECMRGARADGTTKTWIIRLYGEYWCAPFAVDFVSPSLTHTHTRALRAALLVSSCTTCKCISVSTVRLLWLQHIYAYALRFCFCTIYYSFSGGISSGLSQNKAMWKGMWHVRS